MVEKDRTLPQSISSKEWYYTLKWHEFLLKIDQGSEGGGRVRGGRGREVKGGRGVGRNWRRKREKGREGEKGEKGREGERRGEKEREGEKGREGRRKEQTSTGTPRSFWFSLILWRGNKNNFFIFNNKST